MIKNVCGFGYPNIKKVLKSKLTMFKYVTNPEYLEALLSRIKETDDLQTFRSFIHFLDNMNNEFLTE